MSEYAEYAVPPLPPIAARNASTTSQFALDVWLFHTRDGGEIELVAGEITRTASLETAAYLSLFGGNEEDAGLPGDASRQWWGNWSERDPARCYRSETQYLLRTLPATTGNLRRLQPAAENDLAWMVDKALAKSVVVTVGMPGLNRVSIDVLITLASGTPLPLPQYQRAWGKT